MTSAHRFQRDCSKDRNSLNKIPIERLENLSNEQKLMFERQVKQFKPLLDVIKVIYTGEKLFNITDVHRAKG